MGRGAGSSKLWGQAKGKVKDKDQGEGQGGTKAQGHSSSETVNPMWPMRQAQQQAQPIQAGNNDNNSKQEHVQQTSMHAGTIAVSDSLLLEQRRRHASRENADQAGASERGATLIRHAARSIEELTDSVRFAKAHGAGHSRRVHSRRGNSGNHEIGALGSSQWL